MCGRTTGSWTSPKSKSHRNDPRQNESQNSQHLLRRAAETRKQPRRAIGDDAVHAERFHTVHYSGSINRPGMEYQSTLFDFFNYARGNRPVREL